MSNTLVVVLILNMIVLITLGAFINALLHRDYTVEVDLSKLERDIISVIKDSIETVVRETSQGANPSKEDLDIPLTKHVKKERTLYKKFDDSAFKSFMDYRTITDTASKQYEIIKRAYITKCGILAYHDYYCVAMGSFFGDIGNRFEVSLSNGKTLKVIKTDEKADKDTLDGFKMKSDGSVLEFIVNTESLPSDVMKTGDISSIDGFEGDIVKMERVD